MNLEKEERQELFDVLIAPHVSKRQTMTEIAQEYITLKQKYGEILTQRAFARKKGITPARLNQVLRDMPEYTSEMGRQ